MQDSHTVTPTLLAVGAQPISLARRSRASDRHPTRLYRKRAEEDSVPFPYKKGTLASIATQPLFPKPSHDAWPHCSQ